MYHSVYREMTRILDENLLFGASDAILQHLKNPEDIVDQPHEHVIGRGVLASEMQAAWNPLKFLMASRKLCKSTSVLIPMEILFRSRGHGRNTCGRLKSLRSIFTSYSIRSQECQSEVPKKFGPRSLIPAFEGETSCISSIALRALGTTTSPLRTLVMTN
jgi:hypothetical protein